MKQITLYQSATEIGNYNFALNITIEGEGNIDIMRFSGENLAIEGWGAMWDGEKFFPPNFFLFFYKCKKFGSIQPNFCRDDVKKHLHSNTTDFGFSVSIPLDFFNTKFGSVDICDVTVAAIDSSGRCFFINKLSEFSNSYYCLGASSNNLDTTDIGIDNFELGFNLHSSITLKNEWEGNIIVTGHAFFEDSPCKYSIVQRYIVVVNDTIIGTVASNVERGDVSHHYLGCPLNVGFMICIDKSNYFQDINDISIYAQHKMGYCAELLLKNNEICYSKLVKSEELIGFESKVCSSINDELVFFPDIITSCCGIGGSAEYPTPLLYRVNQERERERERERIHI